MLAKELFEKFNGFREDIEIAEDYEFWLRITAFYDVLYIDEPLTVKRAGEWEQLSEKYHQIEIFRINALKTLLENNFFPAEKAMEAKAVFSEKCRIYAAGCSKRGREEDAACYEKLAQLFK